MAKLTPGGQEIKDTVDSGDTDLNKEYRLPFKQKYGRKTTLSDDDLCNFIAHVEADDSLDEPERVKAMEAWERKVTTEAMAGKAA